MSSLTLFSLPSPSSSLLTVLSVLLDSGFFIEVRNWYGNVRRVPEESTRNTKGTQQQTLDSVSTAVAKEVKPSHQNIKKLLQVDLHPYPKGAEDVPTKALTAPRAVEGGKDTSKNIQSQIIKTKRPKPLQNYPKYDKNGSTETTKPTKQNAQREQQEETQTNNQTVKNEHQPDIIQSEWQQWWADPSHNGSCSD